MKPVIHISLRVSERAEENLYQLNLYMNGNMSLSQMKVQRLCFPLVLISRSARAGLWAACRMITGGKTLSPVSEVQNSLDGISTSCTEVSLESRKQRNHHEHSVLLPLSAVRHNVNMCTVKCTI